MKEPYIWLNEEEVDGLADCGCSLNRDYKSSDNPAVFLCPLHEAAGKLLEAAKEMISQFIGEGESIKMPVMSALAIQPSILKLKEAISKSEGKR